MGELLLLELGPMKSSADLNGQADGVSFASAEPLDKPDHPVGHPILFPQKREDVFEGFRSDHSGFSLDPSAFDRPSRVRGSDTYSWIVADAFYLARGGISANEQFSVLFDEPDRCADGIAGFSVGFEADVFLACELGQLVTCSTH